MKNLKFNAQHRLTSNYDIFRTALAIVDRNFMPESEKIQAGLKGSQSQEHAMKQRLDLHLVHVE